MKRITKAEARKRFFADKLFYICPVKMAPDYPFSFSCPVPSSVEYLERAERYRDNETLWKGTPEKTAWELFYTNWAHYNATYETGYYAAYYVDVQL